MRFNNSRFSCDEQRSVLTIAVSAVTDKDVLLIAVLAVMDNDPFEQQPFQL